MDERRLHDDLESLERAAPVASVPALPASRRRRPFLWLPASLALAAGVLIGLFGAQLLPQERNESAGMSPLASSEPASAVLTWSTTNYPDEMGPSFLFVLGDRVIAGGTGSYSDDGGETWIEARKRGMQQGDLALGQIAEHAGRLVSLGSRLAGTSGSDGDRRGVIWTSDDRGQTWQRAATDDVPEIAGDIAATDSGFVAIGRRTDPYPSEVWRSADGIAWQPVETRAFDHAIVSGLGWNGDSLVAVGVVVTDQNRMTYTPMAWSSRDGSTWEAHALGSSGVVSALAVDGVEFIAAGPMTDGKLGVWHSTDGTRWTSETYFDSWKRVTALAAGPLGVVVSGESDIEDTGAWNEKLAYQHSLLAFIPRNGEPTIQDDIAAWPKAMAALSDRFLAIADDCPPYADCFVSYSMLIGRPVTTTTPSFESRPEVTCEGGVQDCTRETLAVLDAVSEVSQPAIRITFRADATCIWFPFGGDNPCPSIAFPKGTLRTSNAVVTFEGTDQQAFLNIFWLSDGSISSDLALVTPPPGATPVE